MASNTDNHIRSVCFKCNQDTIDLYRCIENGRVYARIPGANGANPKWTTTSQWSGGYEPCAPVKVGICFNIYDAFGKFLGSEECIIDSLNTTTGTSIANVVAPFSYHNEREIAQNFLKEQHLISHEDWRKDCIKDKNLIDPDIDTDTWIYCMSKNISSERHAVPNWFNRKLFVECDTFLHNLSNKSYEVYSLVDCNSICLRICGYRWI